MLKEFKDFITGGNVIEFAVAVIMAGAIGKVVNGFVNLIILITKNPSRRLGFFI